jgi:hypothetical protein
MELATVKTQIASALNRAINIPLVPEGCEQLLFERVVAEVYGNMPLAMQASIASVASTMGPTDLESAQKWLKEQIPAIIDRLIFWRRSNADLSEAIQNNLFAMAAEGQSAATYLVDQPA